MYQGPDVPCPLINSKNDVWRIWSRGETRNHQSELRSRHSHSAPSNPRAFIGPGIVSLVSLVHSGFLSSLLNKVVGDKTNLVAFFAATSSMDGPSRALNFMRLQSAIEQYMGSSLCSARYNNGFASLGCIPEASSNHRVTITFPSPPKSRKLIR